MKRLLIIGFLLLLWVPWQTAQDQPAIPPPKLTHAIMKWRVKAPATVLLSGPDSSQFTQTNTCGTTLPGGSNCTISIRFAPTSTGAKSATMTVTSDPWAVRRPSV